jgi:pimeloyl-ACP methyl ester carboxylesterase
MLRSFAGGAVFGEVWGAGPPEVLVLHGWARTHTDFAAVVGPAAPGGPLSTWAPDLPGFGSTPPPPTPWGAGDFAAALAPILDESEDDNGGAGRPVVVLGHSRGGCIAVALAAWRPDLVRALVLTGAPLLPAPGGRRRSPASYRLARALHRRGLISETRMERARQRHGSADYRAARGIMRDTFVRLVNERYDQQLEGLRCPVELVWGDDDDEVPVAVAQAVVEKVPTATLTVVPGAGHLTPLTIPEVLRNCVDRALARV